MRKICIVITARASYSRIKSVLTAIQNHGALELQLIVTGSALLSRFGSILPYLEAEGFPVDAVISNLLDVESLTASAKTTGLAVIELSTCFANLRPDMVVTIADRFETIATAIAAVNMNIPLVHIQGGEVSGNVDDKIRNAVTQMADLHLVATKEAERRLIGKGIPAGRIHRTGCPSIDLLTGHTRTALSPPIRHAMAMSGVDVRKRFLVVLQHPVTTESEHSKWQIENTLEAVEILNIPAVWFCPNADPGTFGMLQSIDDFRQQKPHARIHFLGNIDSAHFIQLLKDCVCLVGNSSVGIRECSALGTPVVNIGKRQCGRERGFNVLDCVPETGAIISAVRYQLAHGPHEPVSIYGDGHAGEKIAHLLADAPIILEKHILPAL